MSITQHFSLMVNGTTRQLALHLLIAPAPMNTVACPLLGKPRSVQWHLLLSVVCCLSLDVQSYSSIARPAHTPVNISPRPARYTLPEHEVFLLLMLKQGPTVDVRLATGS